MMSSLRLLVYTIAAIAVIALVYQIMLPFIFPTPNNILIIERTLEASETGLGKGFFDEVRVQAGEGFSGETFDKKLRNTAFQCNSAALCCPQTEECSLTIEWDNRSIKFNEPRTVLVTTRCDLQHGLYACTVYLGENPAQIEIESVEAPKEIDLGNETLSFDIVFANTGNQETQQTEVKVELFQRYLEEGKWVEKPVEDSLAIEAFGSLKPGQKMQKTIFISLNQNGSFKAKIRANGLEAGFEEKSFEFTATGASQDCGPRDCQNPISLEGKCVARCSCTGCMLGSRCAEAMLEADPLDLGLKPDVSFENAETDVLGSNIVDVILPEEYCFEEPEQGEGGEEGGEDIITPDLESIFDCDNQDPIADPDDLSYEEYCTIMP